MLPMFSTSTLSRSLLPLEDVQLLEKAVAGLERSVEKDFQAMQELDNTRVEIKEMTHVSDIHELT